MLDWLEKIYVRFELWRRTNPTTGVINWGGYSEAPPPPGRIPLPPPPA